MLRLAHEQDVPWLTEQMLQLKQETGWRDEPAGYTTEYVSEWLTSLLRNPLCVCYVWQADTDLPEAFCGAILQRLIQPPHVPLVSEWGWTGSTRQAVSCWHACVEWGKKHGAVYGHRTTSSVAEPRRICETVAWEKL